MTFKTYNMDNLLDQITNITKAHAYDILSQQVKELKEENEALRNRVKYLQDLINEYTAKMLDNISDR